MDIPKHTVYRSSEKSIRLVLRPNGVLSVYCPKRCSKKELEKVIEKYYPELKTKHNQRADLLFGADNTLPYLNNRYPIIYSNVKKFVFDGERFISPSADREKIRKMYREFLKAQAKRLIPPLVEQVAEKFNFKYNSVSIRATYARFGSCSTNGNLNFSLALAAFDPDFVYAVVCHELCHTVYLNHGDEFRALLNSVCPSHDKLHRSYKSEHSVILRSVFFNPAF